MQKINKISLSLIALILCLCTYQSAYAAKWATIISDYAVVYSDIQMTSKIGFIKKGKKVRVGEVARNNGKLLPIIINKRVAYVEIKNLQTSTRLEALQSATQRLKMQAKKKAQKPKRIAAYAGGYLASAEASTSSSSSVVTEGNGNIQFYGFGIRDYQYKDDGSNSGFKSGLEYFSGTSSDTTINYLSFSADYFRHFNNYKGAAIIGYGGLSISPFSELKNSDLYTLNGYGLGFQGGLEAVFQMDKLYFHVDVGYQYLKLMGFDFSKISSSTNFELDYTFMGPRIIGAMSFFY